MSLILDYKMELIEQIKTVTTDDIIEVAKFLFQNREKRIFVGGNGGSCAISNHLVCDHLKGNNLKVISLTSNTPLLTALSNDISYDETLVYQLERLMSPKDIVILISSSGKSPNIIKAAKFASERGTLIGFSGFQGGPLKRLSDYSFHVPCLNYGIIEDVHQSIMHMISQSYAQIKGNK